MATVLLQFGERRKIVKVKKEEGPNDVAVLRRVFFRDFYSGNEDASVYFQRFDQEWDEYIDIDDDYVVTEKDRLRAVVAEDSGRNVVSHHDFDPKQKIGVGSVIFQPLLLLCYLHL